MEEIQIKTASVYRNTDNEIVIDEEGYITCKTDSMYTFLFVSFTSVFCVLIFLFITILLIINYYC